MAQQVAIVGAGAAGAAAAYSLRDRDAEVTIFEKSGGVCGRAASRRREGCVYEYGANYLPADDDHVNDLVTAKLPSEGLVEIDEPIWTFDAAGEITEGRPDQSTKWTYERGITQLAKRLFDATDATVHRNTRVEVLNRTGERWGVTDGAGDDRGRFDALLLTPPAPQTADLLGQSEWQHADRRPLRETIESVPYRTVVAGLLHYDFELDNPYYALLNDDKDHDVGWIGREECKDGHVPDGEALLLVQMAPEWSVDHYREAEAELTDAIAEATADLLGDDRLAEPDWTDHQRWRYALPNDGVPDGSLSLATEHDLFFAGDWVAGEGRLHAALKNGLEAGEQIGQHL